MKNKISWYIRRSKEIIHEEGWREFLNKVLEQHGSIRTCLDEFITMVLAPLYIRGFYKVFAYSEVWTKTYWLGHPILKNPFDLWIYQEIIWETRPDFIIETGTYMGGSALFFASIFDVIGSGKVITIDIRRYSMFSHPKIIQIIGTSTSSEVVKRVENLVKGKKAMVILDSEHRKEHVLKELRLYSSFVAKGCYLVVEDTGINGHPLNPGWGPGPYEAVREFLLENNEFVADREREKFFINFPKAFLKSLK